MQINGLKEEVGGKAGLRGGFDSMAFLFKEKSNCDISQAAIFQCNLNQSLQLKANWA